MVINRMLQVQYDLVKEMTGEAEPYARITFYDELANLMAKGYLSPPCKPKYDLDLRCRAPGPLSLR
jgi:hypothetical protein